MSRLPTLTSRKLTKALRSLGYAEVRQHGSHKIFHNAAVNRTTIVPYHAKDIGRGLLRKILTEINLSPDEFIKLLQK